MSLFFLVAIIKPTFNYYLLSIDNSSFYTLLKKNEKVKKFLFCYTLVLVMVIFSLSVFFLNSLFFVVWFCFLYFIIDKLKLLLYNTIKDEMNYEKEENYNGKRSSEKSK